MSQPHATTRRQFHQHTLGAISAGLVCGASALPAVARVNSSPRVFRLWATSDAHVGADLKHHKRESLADAIRQSERGGNNGAPAFEWDVALHLGDSSGNQGVPKDSEGEEVVRQFGAMREHTREQFYTLAGNHDASFKHQETQWWFRKWHDPTGENTKHSGVDPKSRPYPVEGTWERYTFRVGNLLFAMMSDRNDVGASYLYWVDGKPDAQAFENYLAENRGAIDLWLGAHTHTTPDDRKGGRSHIERKWDANFVNVSALTRCHGHQHSTPMSRLFTFTEGSDQVRVQCYLHTSQYKPEGWYAKVEKTLPISKPFQMNT